MLDQCSITMRTNHISVCIRTFKRSELLKQLLQRLNTHRTDECFTYSVAVADNDSAPLARQVVTSFSATSHVHVTYFCESQQNMALARNKAIKQAEGDLMQLRNIAG